MKRRDLERAGWVQVGQVDVDAGLLMIGDPCYMSHGGIDWDTFCQETIQGMSCSLVTTVQRIEDGKVRGVLNGWTKDQAHSNNEASHSSTLITARTCYGDGSYPVFVMFGEGHTPQGMLVWTEDFEDDEDEEW